MKEGLLWANGPDTFAAVVVDGSGAYKPVREYLGGVPGGPRDPIPKAGGTPGDHGVRRPGGNGSRGDVPVPPPLPSPIAAAGRPAGSPAAGPDRRGLRR